MTRGSLCCCNDFIRVCRIFAALFFLHRLYHTLNFAASLKGVKSILETKELLCNQGQFCNAKDLGFRKGIEKRHFGWLRRRCQLYSCRCQLALFISNLHTLFYKIRLCCNHLFNLPLSFPKSFAYSFLQIHVTNSFS